jgi:hypothetical protein
VPNEWRVISDWAVQLNSGSRSTALGLCESSLYFLVLPRLVITMNRHAGIRLRGSYHEFDYSSHQCVQMRLEVR